MYFPRIFRPFGYNSQKNPRPRLTAFIVGVLLVGGVFYLRFYLEYRAKLEMQEYGEHLAISCAKNVEEFCNIRIALLGQLANRLLSSANAEDIFHQQASFYRNAFGGAFLVVWKQTSGEIAQHIWTEGDPLMDLEAYKAIAQWEGDIEGAVQVMPFWTVDENKGIVSVCHFGEAQLRGTVFWVDTLSDLTSSIVSGVIFKDSKVALKRDSAILHVGQPLTIPLAAATQSFAFIGDETWQVLVQPENAWMRERFQLFSLAITVLGLVLAVGASLTTYFWINTSTSLREISLRDALTGLRNRRAFNDFFEREVAIAERYGRALSLMIVDLDHFKRINDTMGHSCGDQILEEAAEAIRSEMRDTDVAFRYGGEEFAVILTETNLMAAAGVAERVRQAIAKYPFRTSQGAVQLTTSIGVTGYRTGESVDQFLTRADLALYRAKSTGRNQVVTERPSGWEA